MRKRGNLKHYIRMSQKKGKYVFNLKIKQYEKNSVLHWLIASPV